MAGAVVRQTGSSALLPFTSAVVAPASGEHVEALDGAEAIAA